MTHARHPDPTVHLIHPHRWWWLVLAALVSLAVSHRLEAQDVLVLRAPAPIFVAPSLNSPVAYSWPEGIQVEVPGCTPDQSWCEVSWGNEQGWVQASLLLRLANTPVYGSQVAPWPAPVIIYRETRFPTHREDWHHDHDEDHHDHDHDDHGWQDHRGGQVEHGSNPWGNRGSPVPSPSHPGHGIPVKPSDAFSPRPADGGGHLPHR